MVLMVLLCITAGMGVNFTALPRYWGQSRRGSHGYGIVPAVLRERGCYFLIEVQKQSMLMTLRRTVNETSVNDNEPDSATAVEPVHKKMKTDITGNGAADFVADLFDRSTLMMVVKVDNYRHTSGTEVSDDLLCFWQGSSNA